ncbi:CENP-A chaperone Scm3 [Schizosaccharomyces cryophilus OY26]|uniref:CENP-A chaperone Scm3 n=1 Tax=Schizosaccharomyces cryophilus (strain OY26 / ATCC MYA-4695 / CBS 11777 / NBRC 106824 / NRRL Y48691) TaxID=653667 RepID=S9VZB6_SCHCR|nr:CENP-A chaperone Scm3 [Schizosaccharomyces cryophilus OY26]EPY52973.1 CENP-A chaperone Scm3 [Schizosaccharomyces cryophilus OY26]
MNLFQNEGHESFGNSESHPFQENGPTSAVAYPMQLSATDDLLERRRASQKRYEQFLASLFEKYGRDTSDIADEIDLSTGKIVVNRGHLLGLKNKNDVWAPEDELGSAHEHMRAAPTFPSSKLAKDEYHSTAARLEQCDLEIADDIPLISFFQNKVGSSLPSNHSTVSRTSHSKEETQDTCNDTTMKEQDVASQVSSHLSVSSHTVSSSSSEGATRKSLSKDSNDISYSLSPNTKSNLEVKENLDSTPLVNAKMNEMPKDSQAEPHTNNITLQEGLKNPFQTPERPPKRGSTFSKRLKSLSTSTKKRNFVSLLSMVSPRPSFVYRDSQSFVAKPVSASQISVPTSVPSVKHHSKEHCGKPFCFECLTKSSGPKQK